MFTADPQAIADNDNVFGLLPVKTGLKIAVWLMVIHQVIFLLRHVPLALSESAINEG